jgi:siroheme synthase (precorrin-2 oxidase/ferrochelatase)
MVAPRICVGAREGALSFVKLSLVERSYRSDDIGSATLVIAATNVRAVNAQVTADASRACRLINVADASAEGHFVTVAAYRADPLVIGVSSGVPKAAARIRDAIALRFDARYRAAVSGLAALRRQLLSRGDAGGWHTAESALIDEQFCARVEDGTFAERLVEWESEPARDPAHGT